VRTVHAGRQYIEADLLHRALQGMLRREDARSAAAGQLTPREIEVVRMVAAGLHNKDIAARLGISQGTVKIHLHNIYEKVDVSSRVQLTLFAQAKGIL
jgi:DNA-binding NarL/FixJ family response regulator